MICNSILETIGHTPLVEMKRLADANACKAHILAKIESRNPGGSTKDRAALTMLLGAQEKGLLKPGMLIIEPTSGNTGIGLAVACAVLGYRLILVMPESMSIERRKLAKAYGAEVVLTPADDGMAGSVREAEKLAAEKNGFIPGQFDNPDNALAHYNTTAPEILSDLEGAKLAAFVATVGTGGTLTGNAKRLKEADAATKIIAVEPEESPLLSRGYSGHHGIQGIGADFVPTVLDQSLIDEIMTVTTDDAVCYARESAKREGVFCGISSGAALAAAIRLGKREEFAGKNIVVILPDTGERYLSTALCEEA